MLPFITRLTLRNDVGVGQKVAELFGDDVSIKSHA